MRAPAMKFFHRRFMLFLGAGLVALTTTSAWAGNVTLQAPGTGSAWSLTLPTSAGTNNYVLSTNGTGTTSWVAPTSGSTALSAITSAPQTNTFDNAAYAQTWTWNTLSTGTAMTISSTSLTTGVLLSLQNTNTAETGYVLSLSNSTTGAGYGIYSTMSGTANAGYAGYFTVTATSGSNYAVVGTSASSTGYGGYFTNSTTGATAFALEATGTSYFKGNMGIGTATPVAEFHVDSPYGGNGPFGINNSSQPMLTFDSYGNLKLNTVVSTFIGYDNNIQESAYSNYATTYITCGYNGSSACNIFFLPNSGGLTSINQATPEATLDIGGFMRLTAETAQPVACSSTYNGSLAVTAVGTICVCKGSSNAWYLASNGTTACTW